MEPHVSDQVEAMQPRKGALLLLVPVALVFATLVAYVGLFALGVIGRAADGERVVLAFAACPEAQPVIARRVDGMGLGDPQFATTPEGFSLTVTLPSDPDVAAAIPTTLATPGRLVARRVGAPEPVLFTEARVTSASIRQDLTMIPWTVLTLDEAGVASLLAWAREQREGRVEYLLDGAPIGEVSNTQPISAEVELSPMLEDDRLRLHRAAEWAIVLNGGPLPCPVTARRASGAP